VEHPQLTGRYTGEQHQYVWATDREIWPVWPAQIGVRGANIGGRPRIRTADPLGVNEMQTARYTESAALSLRPIAFCSRPLRLFLLRICCAPTDPARRLDDTTFPAGDVMPIVLLDDLDGHAAVVGHLIDGHTGAQVP
jgi:hypothetical protein